MPVTNESHLWVAETINNRREDIILKTTAKSLAKLFISSFNISLFIIGGGYVAIPLLQKKFVEELHWIEKEEMTDLVAIAQSAPGAIAVNASISVGYRVAGIPGALCSLLGTVSPPLILITFIQAFYAQFIDNRVISAVFKGMNCAVAAVMIDVVLKMGTDAVKGVKHLAIPLMLASFAAVFLVGVNPAFIVLACIGAGLAPALFTRMKKKQGRRSA